MKIYAFIDSQNLNLGVLSLGWKLDFARFRRFLADKYHVDTAFLFIGYISENQHLYDYLERSGYCVIYKPTIQGKKLGVNSTKGNVDAELVLHAMIEYANYEKAIIVSGDGDFYCLVEYLEKNNKLEKIIVPNLKYSSLLRKYSPYIVSIDLFREKVREK